MPRYLDLETWPRRPHFEFFRNLAEPFFDVTVEVDVTELRRVCRERGHSFFEASSFCSLRAANAVENFRYRLRRDAVAGDRVVVHDVIHGSCTVMRPDETFGFSYFEYRPDFPAFAAGARSAMDAAAAAVDLDDAGSGADDLIYYSVLPWLPFTSFRHARSSDPNDSVPRIVFGQYRADGDRCRMPVSLSLHHALADGLHAGRFYQRFQAELAAAADLLGCPA